MHHFEEENVKRIMHKFKSGHFKRVSVLFSLALLAKTISQDSSDFTCLQKNLVAV